MRETDLLLNMQLTFLYEADQQTDLTLCTQDTVQLNAGSVPPRRFQERRIHPL